MSDYIPQTSVKSGFYNREELLWLTPDFLALSLEDGGGGMDENHLACSQSLQELLQEDHSLKSC